MTGMARRVHAAQGRLARLVVAVALLAGLGLAIGLQCNDGMAVSMAMPMAPGTNAMACGSPAGMAPERVASACEGAVTLAEEDSPGPHGLGGVLATCLAFILAVAAAVATLRPLQVRSVARLLRSPRVMIRAVQPRAPSLAELCLLRT